MKNEETQTGIAKASKQKKVSFFSAIFIVMGSSIGAGIFFKSKGVLDLSQSSIILAIFCWIIAAMSVIAMALALLEIASVRNDNLSFLGWTKIFNSRTTFKASKNFMFYIYMPLTFFFMPMYVLQSLQDGIGALVNEDASTFTLGTSVDWIIWAVIALMISLYFIVSAGISSRIGNIQNKIVMYIKFFPLIFVALTGFILVGLNAGGINEVSVGVVKPNSVITIASGAALQEFAPGLGLFLGISAIFFAYDGFYVVAGIQTEMKKPKKTPIAILLGLAATTAVYLIIAISMSINGGSFFGMLDFMMAQWGTTGRILFGVVNIMISIGVLGIINGFALWAPRFTEDLIKEGELPLSLKYKNNLSDTRPKIGIKYVLISTIPVFVTFTILGALAYIPNSDYNTYGSGMASLYNFADLMSTWTSVFAFGFIAVSIYGAYKNRKTKKIATIEKKYFKVAAIISILIVGLSIATSILMPIIDLFLVTQISDEAIAFRNLTLESDLTYSTIIISRIMVVITLLIFSVLTYGITILEDFLNIKKHGSIEKYNSWHKENFITIAPVNLPK